MNNHLSIKLTGLTLDQANAARDMGFDAGRSTATFVGLPEKVLATIRSASADLKAAKKAAGERVGNAPHIDNLARKYEMAAANTIAENAHKAEADARLAAHVEANAVEIDAIVNDIMRPARILTPSEEARLTAPAATNRIPAGATSHTCAACHTDKPISAYPTVTGPTDRRTTCRPCRKGA